MADYRTAVSAWSDYDPDQDLNQPEVQSWTDYDPDVDFGMVKPKHTEIKMPKPGEKFDKAEQFVTGGAQRLGAEAYGGLVRAAGGIEWLIAAGLETVYDTGRIIGMEGYKAVTGEYPGGGTVPNFEKTDYLTSNIKQATEELQSGVGALSVNLPRDEDRTFAEKTVGRIAEYAAPTQAVTRNVLQYGTKLAANPALIAEKGVKASFQKAAVTASKNPQAAIKLEQGISAIVATAGQVAEEMGLSPTQQLLVEVATGIMSGQIANKTTAIADFFKKKMPGAIKSAAKNEAAGYMQAVKEADPEFAQKFARGEELAQKTGIKLDTAELANNPELKAAKQALTALDAGSSTGIDAKLKAQTKQISEAFPRPQETQAKAVSQLEAYRQGVETELATRARTAIDAIVDEVDRVAPINRAEAGLKGREMLLAAKEASDDGVKALYKKVGNPTLPINTIKASINEAAKSELKGNQFLGLLDSHTKNLLKQNFGKDSKSLSLNAIRDFQSHLGQQMTNARLAGDAQKERLYTIMFKGVERQLDEVAGSTDDLLKQLDDANLPESLKFQQGLGPEEKLRVPRTKTPKMLKPQAGAEHLDMNPDQIEALRQAKAAAKQHHDLFSQGEVLLATKTGAQGMDKITTTDFINHFIRPDSGAKTARVEEAVSNFYNAYGKTPEAIDYMANSFGVLLKEEIGKNPSSKAVASILKRYGRFLETAGIKDRYSNVDRAIRQANIADANMVLDKATFPKTALGKFMKTDDPVKAVMDAVNKKTVDKLFADVDKIPNAARRETIKTGLRDALWEGLYNKTITSQNIDDVMLLDTGTIRKMMAQNGDTIRSALGKAHAKNIDDLMDVIDRVSQDVSAAHGLPAKPDENLVEKLLTGLRAAAHGFVRPDLIVAQMSMRGTKAMLNKHTRAILKEALDNPEFAKELLKLDTTIEGRAILKSIYAPLVSATVTDRSEE